MNKQISPTPVGVKLDRKVTKILVLDTEPKLKGMPMQQYDVSGGRMRKIKD